MPLRVLFCILLVIAFSDASEAQPAEAEMIKAAVAKISAAKRQPIRIMLRSLSEMEAVVTSAGEESFTVMIQKVKDWSKERTILYKDVLAISGAGINVSLVPDPAMTTPYGSWDAVAGITRRQRIGIVLANGKDMNGWFGGATPTSLTLLGPTDQSIMKVPRAQIVRVFGLKRGGPGVKEYTRRGLKGGSEVGAPEALIVAPVSAGIGALIGLAKQSKESIILVYSR